MRYFKTQWKVCNKCKKEKAIIAFHDCMDECKICDDVTRKKTARIKYNIRNNKHILELSKTYVRAVLIHHHKINKHVLNKYPELEEVQRLIIKTKRLWRTSQN